MKITDLEYGVIMQAIQNAYNEIAEDTFIDPYDNEEKVTNEQAENALKSIEAKLIKEFTE